MTDPHSLGNATQAELVDRSVISTMPAGRAAVVAEAAYLVPLEQPADVVAQVRDFWASSLATAG